jgi:hypothetical protein
VPTASEPESVRRPNPLGDDRPRFRVARVGRGTRQLSNLALRGRTGPRSATRSSDSDSRRRTDSGSDVVSRTDAALATSNRKLLEGFALREHRPRSVEAPRSTRHCPRSAEPSRSTTDGPRATKAARRIRRRVNAWRSINTAWCKNPSALNRSAQRSCALKTLQILRIE